MAPFKMSLLACTSILTIVQCAEIWSDTLKLSNFAFGIGIQWEVGQNPAGSITYPPDVDTTKCPNLQWCWAFMQNYYAYYIHPTSNYNNIKLTVSIAAQSLETGTIDDSCNVYYSIDSSTNWSSIASWTASDTFPITQTISLPTDASDNTGIGIKLQVESHSNGNKQDYCYFSDIILEGDIISTSAPQTSNPTKAPTKYPTVSLTFNPTQVTLIPTAPTTANPALIPTKAPTTANTDTEYGDDDDNRQNNGDTNGSGANIGVYLAIVCVIVAAVIVVIVYKKKKDRKKSEEIHDVVKRNATLQYMDAYAGTQQSSPAITDITAAAPQAQDAAKPVSKEPLRTEQAESALRGPSPPMQLTQIFGPTQKEKVENNNDSDSDSLLKMQARFSKDANA